MTAPQPVDMRVTAGTDSVYMTWGFDGVEDYLVIPPAQARTLAAELLTNADRAQGLPITTWANTNNNNDNKGTR